MAALERMHIQGYRALADFEMEFGDLTVLIGPNASGKSSIADVLAFVSEALGDSLMVPVGKRGGMVSLLWNGGAGCVGIELQASHQWPDEGAPADVYRYRFEVRGDPPLEAPVLVDEDLSRWGPPGDPAAGAWTSLLTRDSRVMSVLGRPARPPLIDPDDLTSSRLFMAWLGSSHPSNEMRAFWAVRALLRSVGVHSPFAVGPESPIRRPYDPSSRTSPDTALQPSAENLTGVVSLLKTDVAHSDLFVQLEEWLSLAFPEFSGLGVSSAVAGAGQSLQWQEFGRKPMHPGQLSDGILRFLCLATLCASPRPPSIVVVDEPEIGLHPRLLPIVAAMLETLSERTQVIVITHSPSLLSGFPLDSIVVTSKDENGCHAHRPADSPALRRMLEPTVGETLGSLFESGELEIPRSAGRPKAGEEQR